MMLSVASILAKRGLATATRRFVLPILSTREPTQPSAINRVESRRHGSSESFVSYFGYLCLFLISCT